MYLVKIHFMMNLPYKASIIMDYRKHNTAQTTIPQLAAQKQTKNVHCMASDMKIMNHQNRKPL